MQTHPLTATRTVAPATEPVTLAEIQTHVRSDIAADETYLADLIGVAREHVEEMTGRALVTQTWALDLDAFPGSRVIKLPRPPLIAVTGVTYMDADGATQTVDAADYIAHATGDDPAEVSLAYNASWPSTYSERDAVTVTYTAGYGPNAEDVPAALRHAIKLLAGHMYAHREPEITGAVVARLGLSFDALISPYIVRWY